nr:23S rRNA (uracil(1939)-C(5))-methyltransferase RlmD [uncultured Shuttleworthia sp.]
MQKNDLFPLTIEDMAVGGEGIGHDQGMTFFVKGAVLGDQIMARATKVKKNYGYARVEEILRASENRVPEACPIARQCGGCQLQALSYEKQKVWKERRVRNDLIRIGGFAPELVDRVMEPILGMEKAFRYRNKAQFPLGENREGEIISGFYAARSHRIIPIDDCLLGAPENESILKAVKDYMRACGIRPYNEVTGRGLVRHVLIRKGFASGQIMVCLIINGRELPRQQKLVDRLTKIAGMKSICINSNCKQTNVIMGDETRCVWGQESIVDYIGDIAFAISPRSFYQVNPYQTARLYEKALEYADLKGQESVWDLYCGIGTISLFLARKAGQVYGVEIIPEAIEDARANARRNDIENVHFFVGKAEEILPDFYEGRRDAVAGDALHPDVIVVDPPRKGCDDICLQTMLRMRPDRIVYVSCDPATLARDLKTLAEGGYSLQRVCPVDQFPQTTHVETVALLSKLDSKKYISVELPMDDMDLTSAESKATYKQKVQIKFNHMMNLLIVTMQIEWLLQLTLNFYSEKKNFKISSMLILKWMLLYLVVHQVREKHV